MMTAQARQQSHFILCYMLWQQVGSAWLFVVLLMTALHIGLRFSVLSSSYDACLPLGSSGSCLVILTFGATLTLQFLIVPFSTACGLPAFLPVTQPDFSYCSCGVPYLAAQRPRAPAPPPSARHGPF